ncbi:SDR family NAD(P)-dependent oxidoreductase [Streptomyces albus]|uniref:SDR family NAD(P)-dependent oxidoreductase n=1 Tax=Streptomyces albus TaxID=1888 RepID=UPI0006E1954D|nr:SDR family NAD(P)-dependent oxidoreductase [Streptomyces albus]
MAVVTRTALVTGGNRGIGHAVAALLHTRGHRVIVASRNGAEARSVAGRLGDGARGVALDVTDTEAVAGLPARVGEVDILVNNAGVQLDWGERPTGIDLALVGRTLDVNLLGAWRMAQAFVPHMVRRGWGRVVNISSGTASFALGLPGECPAYSVSKASLNALTVLLARETEGTGVLVNAINPGLVRSRMRPDAEQSPQEAAEHIVRAAMLPDDGPSGAFLRREAVIGW